MNQVGPAEAVVVGLSTPEFRDLMAERHAELWINHHKVQSDTQRHAPLHYE